MTEKDGAFSLDGRILYWDLTFPVFQEKRLQILGGERAKNRSLFNWDYQTALLRSRLNAILHWNLRLGKLMTNYISWCFYNRGLPFQFMDCVASAAEKHELVGFQNIQHIQPRVICKRNSKRELYEIDFMVNA